MTSVFQVPGPHFKGNYSSLFQNPTVDASQSAGPLSPRSALRLCEGGRVLLRSQPGGAEGLDDAARAR